MEYILQTDSLCKQYGSCKALDALTMHIPKGSIYGLVGKNGAGKTTLMRMISGLQEPTSGTYTLFGTANKSREICKARLRMGAVIETPSIYPNMTAEDNLRQQYKVLGIPDYADIPELLRLVGLADTGKKTAKNFSLGMRQRLGIAVALCGNPDFLILDEPVNGLDPQGIVEIRELLLKLNRERATTVLISSHILEELSKLATHYGFVDHGKMIRELSAEELEAACRKAQHLTVSDTKIFAGVLDKMGLEYSILDETTAEIYGQATVTEIVTALAAENCTVYTMHERDESLESFFVNLVGGATE